MGPIANGLTEKLEALSADQLAEVESFVSRLRLDDSERMHRSAFSKLSEPALSAVWDNSDDDIYSTTHS